MSEVVCDSDSVSILSNLDFKFIPSIFAVTLEKGII